MVKQTPQSVIIHFKDGTIQTGILKSSLLTGKDVQYQPLSPLNDRRKVPRMPFIKEVRVDQLGIQRATDLSPYGMYVECLTTYPIGTILPISIDLKKEILFLDACVAFHDPGIGMGLEFHRPSPALRLKLEALFHQAMHGTKSGPRIERRERKERRDFQRDNRLSQKESDTGNQCPDRRKNTNQLKEVVRAKVSSIKSIFFKNSFRISETKGQEVIIEFFDGEEILVNYYEDLYENVPKESEGFFADTLTEENSSYVIFIVKSAIRNIQRL